MPFGRLLATAGVLFALFAVIPARADDLPPSPERREILVPVTDLPTVLQQNPRAVALTREQYETLLRDAHKQLQPAPEPPRRAAITSAVYTAELRGSVVEVHAEFVVQSFSDKWSEIPLRLGATALGEIEVDGETGLQAGGKDARTLLVRGRGEHKLRTTFTLPVQRDTSLSSIALALPSAGAGSFTITLPPHTHVESALPVKIDNTAGATVAVLATSGPIDLALAWRAESEASDAPPVIFEADSFLYLIDDTKVQADLGIVLNTALGNLPAQFQISLPPGATPLGVQGSEVLKWNAADGVVSVELTPGRRKTAALRVLVETAALAGKQQAMLSLPTPTVSGVYRSVGKIAVIGSREIKIRAIAAAPPATQTEGAFPPQIEGDTNFVAAYQFSARTKPLVVSVEKIAPRFSVDLDTLVEVRREAILVERVVALSPDEGEVFSATIALPADEELLTVREGDTEPDWERVPGARGSIHLHWPEAVAVGGRKVFAIKTRIEPADWTSLKEYALAVGDAKVGGAEKTNGYIAAKSDETFRIETRATDGLERRDGRVTPLRGDFAWFRRNDFKLTLQIVRRTPEVRATFTGYALPLAGALSIHGEIGYEIDFSGVKTFRVKVPKETAEQFHFEGDGIAERKLDGDTWTVTLQKETLGRLALKVSAMLPFQRGTDSKFEIAAPSITPLDVQRDRGTWVVEANTDTEIAFESSGMNETDSLRAPSLSDYQPQHRIIGVFEYLGAQTHSLKLLGERHATATLLTTVVDSLALNSVIAPSGVDRHEAVIVLRTAGDQFLDIELPTGAGLLSLAVDGTAVKPVGETANIVRVQLAAEPDRATRIQLIYETPARTWLGSGSDTVLAPRLDTRIPILRTSWHVYLPDGFSYDDFQTNLNRGTAKVEPVLFSKVAHALISPFRTVAFSARGREFRRSAQEPADQPMEERDAESNHFGVMPPPKLAATPAPAKPALPELERLGGKPAATAEAAKAMNDFSRTDGRKGNQSELEKREQSEGKTGKDAQLFFDYKASDIGVKISGLLPVQFELPLTGNRFDFDGLYAPDRVQFRYLNWWSQSRVAWILFAAGALTFLFFGQTRPWYRMLLGVLALTFVPLIVTPMATGACNALLAGWLVSFALGRLARWFVFRPRIVEAMAKA